MTGVRTHETNTSIMNSNDDEKNSLNNLLDQSPANASEDDDVEIVIRPDGKKVRRVRKTVARGTSSASLPATPSGSSEIYIRPDGKKVRRVRRQTSTQSTVSSATMPAAAPTSTSEVYINKDGKKVRRVVKKKSPTGASVASAKNADAEGEIYIRPDGKKVRRVRRSVSSASIGPASSSDDEKPKLSGFLRENASPVTGAAATVSGDGRAAGEIYINKDGKRVRRVRKPKASGETSVSGDSAVAPQEGHIYINKDGKRVRRVVRRSKSTDGLGEAAPLGNLLDKSNDLPKSNSGAATVSNDHGIGEIYINAQGKRVRKVRKTKPGAQSVASAPAKGEVYINKDGKKVRRVVRRSKSAESVDGSPTSGPMLGATESSKPGAAGSATVAGDIQPEGEIYIRADGKKVRRVRKPKPSSGGALSDSSDGKPPAGSASVGGGRKLDGEIIVRPDGKKVIRRPKSKSGSDSSGSEIYRRADGKLVRRVKRSQSSDSVPASDQPPSEKSIVASSPPANPTIQLTKEEEKTASEYRKMRKMGLPDEAVRHKMTVSDVHPKVIAAVFEEKWEEPAPVEDKKPAAVPIPPTPVKTSPSPPPKASPPTATTTTAFASHEESEAPTVSLSAEEEDIASTYRKMKRMGLPDDAVRHKMTVSSVHPKIIAAVFGEQWEEEKEPEKPVAPRIDLTDEEEGAADTYTKMLKMGMPEGAVRHKMVATDVHPKIIASVFGEEWNEPAPDTAKETKPATPKSTEEDVADQYRKMLRMGLPSDAVRHKMAMGGVDPKIIANVIRQETKEPDSPPAAVEEDSPSLSSDEEATAEQYRKMLKMGLPADAVRHKMVLGEVDPRVISAVLESKLEEGGSGTAERTSSSGLTHDEENTANQYRKMLKMGLPLDAVRHKMVLGEVDPKIISVVLESKEPPALASEPPTISASAPSSATVATPSPTSSTPKSATSNDNMAGTAAPNAVAYVVVVGDGEPGTSTPSSASINDKDFVVKPDEKFAVKVADEANPAGSKHTKFFTLKELADLSGKNASELEAVVMEKRKRGASPPRFSLLPLNEQKYEVSLPQVPNGSAAPSQARLPTKNSKEVKEGQEVVDSELAQAARAVTALGNGDMAALLEKLKAGDMKELLEKLHEAEKRQKKLEKQLAQSGIAIAEDIEYNEAKLKVEEIAKRMNEIGGSDVTVADKEEQNKLREEYFKLEQEMERYNTALVLTEEYQAEQDRIEQLWEATNAPENQKALRKLRRHMPVNIRHLSEADLTTKPSPNGKYLPKAIAKKFKRTNVLQCLRLNPDDIECMHPATLENMRVTGLTLTERRALYAHLESIGPKWKKNKAEKMTERKWTWYQMMKSNFKETVAPYQRHVEKYGPPENHPYATRDNPNAGCPLIGKQCPIKADKIIDYDGDYGWTEAAEFEVSEVRKADVEDSGAKAMAEARELAKSKKANDRADNLKKHYKGKLLQVSKANGSCENMDEAMDSMENNITRWVEFIMDKGAEDKKELAYFTDALNEYKLKLLDFAQRSGMQMTGKKTAGGDSADIRSAVEASLAEEVGECSSQFFKFIRDRMKELGARDTRITKTMEMLEGILDDLHGRNLAVLKALGVKRTERSRKLKTCSDLKKAVEEKRKAAAAESGEPEESEAPAAGPGGGGGGRGGLLGDIAGRGRGGGGGRGGLLDALKGGRGRGRGGGGGRGGLMDAIAGRGKKPAAGGRGGLMDAIAGRGKKPAAAGGRGGLMDAIAARGRGRGGGGPGGGRGGLMAAIAARGNG